MSDTNRCTLTFATLIKNYKAVQDKLLAKVRALASNMSQATPGDFILLQFGMANVTQMGESISNLISQVNSLISRAVNNQKTN